MLQNGNVNVYFISGLGADERTFQKLVLPKHWSITHIPWLPIEQDETLLSYSTKLSKLFDTSKPFVVVGLSFGGIVAIELAKLLQPKLIILISSIATRQEMPFYFKKPGMLKLLNTVPTTLLNKASRFNYWFAGMKTTGEKKLIRDILYNTSPSFIKWAVNEIFLWENEVKPANVFHIHGTSDRIFFCHKTAADMKVKGGSHFMVYTKANLISKILSDKINEL